MKPKASAPRCVLTQSRSASRPIQSDIDARKVLMGEEVSRWREHTYRGGPPPPRIKKMQLAHETRARRLGLRWDMIDLRLVYAHWKGRCGICGEVVGIDEFTIDHIIPVSRDGPHLFENLQPAHRECNTRKGDRIWDVPS